MSLFGTPSAAKPSLFGPTPTAPAAQPATTSLFGNTTASQPQQQQGTNAFGSTFGSGAKPASTLFGTSQPQQQPNKPAPLSLFGNTQNQQQQQAQQSTTGLFGQSTQPQSTGLFGTSTQTQQPQTTSLFGSSTQTQQPQSTGLFGSTTQQQPQQANSLFGSTNQQPQSTSLFGSTTQPQSTSLFGSTQPQQQSSLFGSTNNTQQLGASTANGQQQQQQPSLRRSVAPVWQPGSVLGILIGERSIPEQMQILLEKWSPRSPQCTFQTYFYDQAPEQYVAFFGPEAYEDGEKWEEAYKKRPFPRAVPHLSRGFEELGQRLRTQTDAVSKLQQRIHEINASLDAILSKHDLELSVKIVDARRRHVSLSQRTLKLAAKVQVLRNRGYNLDSAEEELKSKLRELERRAFDPALSGRAEEIWARLVGIKNRLQYLQIEVDRNGGEIGNDATKTNGNGAALDEDVVRRTKKILSEYDTQIAHLKSELAEVTKDFTAAAESVSNNASRR